MPGTNTLAYYDTATITAMKSFIVQAPGETGGQLYSDTSPFSIPWFVRRKPFRPVPGFPGKTRANVIKAHLHVSPISH